MKALLLNRVTVLMGILLTAAASQALATVPHEPVPESYYRDLRPDYNRTWYIYKDNDTTPDGILDPGDILVQQFKNWWTPVSSGSQGLYDSNASSTGDLSSAPMNWATWQFWNNPGDPNNVAAYNYWLDRKPNTLSFYMSYSQLDNCDWYDPGFVYGADDANHPHQQEIARQRHQGRNGWTLGWVTGNYDDPNQTAGFANMDILVHNGKLDANVQRLGAQRLQPSGGHERRHRSGAQHRQDAGLDAVLGDAPPGHL